MPTPNYKIVFKLTRGEIVESVHYGAIAVITADHKTYASYGNPGLVTYLRSSAKPFQALPFVENGGPEHYGLSAKEIALICASHSGTDEHVTVAQSIQAKTGVKESDLLCGVHMPGHWATSERLIKQGQKPQPNQHNCSGKHTGMVAFARLLNLPYGMEDHAYIDPDHPIQKVILETFAAMCSYPSNQVEIGIDGCSAPNFAVPLSSAALAYARLCDPKALPASRQAACHTIFEAMVSYPEMVGGPDSFDTLLMQVKRGKLVCKGGAEGYQAIGIKPGVLGPGSPAMGITFKISDGDYRGKARPAVALEILRQLGALTAEELQTLSEYGPELSIDNWRKLLVGKAYPCFTLNQ
jgi:L-asparaginase II